MAAKTKKPLAPGSVVVGTLVELDVVGGARVTWPGREGEPCPARSAVALDTSAAGREVVLAFEDGDWKRPLVLGLLLRPGRPEPKPARAEVDGETVVLTGRREIVLRCGRASITLTRAGKILLRGAYVSSRSSGVNRIKGGSVQIN